jgi:predicted nucleic acid-binding protein
VIRHERGVLDTNIVAAFKLFDPAELPAESAITAVTLGELSRGPYATDEPVKRAGRIAALQHAEAAFGDPLPYDAEAVGRRPGFSAWAAFTAAADRVQALTGGTEATTWPTCERFGRW